MIKGIPISQEKGKSKQAKETPGKAKVGSKREEPLR
jgi:hypothetical protein